MPAPDDAGAIGELWEAKGWPSTRDFHELLVEMGSNLSWSQVCHRVRAYCAKRNNGNQDITAYRAKYAEPAADKPPKDTSERHAVREDETGAVAWAIGQTIHTVDELLDACNVDRELWEVERYLLNSWEMIGKNKDVQPLLQVKAWLKRRAIQPFESAFEALLDTVRVRAPAVPSLVRAVGEYLLVPSFVDAHFGALSADGEYTLVAAERQFGAAAEAMIRRVRALDMPVDRILLPVGNDALHVDNLQSTTTNMTWVQEAADVRDAIVVVCRAYTSLIASLSEIAPVDVIAIAGNHDALNTFWLGMYLDAWYHNNMRVSVDVGKEPRKYYRYGTNLLGLTHGDRIRAEKLVITMATESPPEMWAGSEYREWLTGHLHRKAHMHYGSIEEGGVHVRVLPAFVPSDNWHTLRGFVGNHRAATALYYHRQHGPAGEFAVYVDEQQQAARRAAAA